MDLRIRLFEQFMRSRNIRGKQCVNIFRFVTIVQFSN